MSIEALLAILTSAGLICLIWGIERAVRRDRTVLDKRLRRYGGRAYQLTDDEQKQAASVQVTNMLAKRVEASISGRTFAAALRTDLARANLKRQLQDILARHRGQRRGRRAEAVHAGRLNQTRHCRA